MKNILILALFLIGINSIAQTDELYNIIRINGKIHNISSGEDLSQGNTLKPKVGAESPCPLNEDFGNYDSSDDLEAQWTFGDVHEYSDETSTQIASICPSCSWPLKHGNRR